MTRNKQGDRQDPAEQKQTDTEVETNDQPDAPTDEEDSPAPVPTEPEPVTVAPADQSDVKTDNVHGVDYTVTPDQGYRRS